MSKVSGTDSLGSLLNLGANTAAQGKSSSEDAAGLFASMLQGIPAEADAAGTVPAETITGTSSTSDESSTNASTTTPDTDALTATASTVTTDNPAALEATTLASTALSTAAIGANADESISAPGTQEAVQLFEDQLALHNRFAAAENSKSPNGKALGHDKEAVHSASTKFISTELDDTAPARGRKTARADADSGTAAPEAEASAIKTGKSLMDLADHAPENAGDTEYKDAAGIAAASATATLEDDTYAQPNNTAANTGVRNATRVAAGLNHAPGFTGNFATTGKGLPHTGKTLPNGKDDNSKIAQDKDQSSITLAGFTEVSALEDTGFSFDDIASSFFTQAGTESTPSAATATSATAFAIGSAGESLVDSSAPELLPESATATLDSDSTMGSYAWVEDTATQLSMLHEQGVEKAHIRLHPEELGSLDVTITVNEGQAYIQFVTSTPEARELLQNSLPNLRELLQHSGLALAEGNVSHSDAQKQQGFEQNPQQPHLTSGKEQPQPSSWMRPAVQSRSQIDYYI